MARSSIQGNRRPPLIRMLRGVIWVMAGLVVVVAGALAFTQTGIVRGWIANKIEASVNETVNGRLEIGDLGGNLFFKVELSDIRFIVGRDTIATIPTVRLRYDFWPLLSGTIQIDSLVIEGPTLSLSQDSAKVWSVTRVVPLEDSEPATDTAASEFDYDIVLGAFALKNGKIQLNTTERLIPRIIDSLNIAFSGTYTETHQSVSLQQISFRAREPQFVLNHLSLNLERTDGATTISDFSLRTSENELAASAEYVPSDSQTSKAEVSSKPLKFGELAFVMPDIELIASPTIDLAANLRGDSVSLELSVTEGVQSLHLKSYLANVSSLIDSASGVPPRYGAKIRLNQINPDAWLREPPINFQLTGEIDFTGQGRDLETMTGALMARLQDCTVQNKPVGDFRLDAIWDSGYAEGTLSVDADFGRVDMLAQVDDIFGEPHATAKGTMSSLNVAALVDNDSLRSHLNAAFDVNVTGREFASLRGDAEIAMSASSIADIAIDTLETSFVFADGRASIDTLYLATEALDLRGKGTLDTSMFFDGYLALELGDLSELSAFLEADSLAGRGTVSGAVTGTMNAFACDVDVHLSELTYNAVSIAGMTGHVQGTVDSIDYRLHGDVQADRVLVSEFVVDSATCFFVSTKNQSQAEFIIWQSDSMSSHGAVDIRIDSAMTVLIEELDFNVKGQTWSSGRPSRVVVAGGEYTVDSLFLIGPSDAQSREQRVLVNGTLSLTGREDLQLAIASMDMAAVGAFAGLPYTLGGTHSMELALSGTADEPMISGWGKIVDGRIADFVYDSLYGDLQYRDGHFTAVQTLVPNEAGSLHIEAALSLNLSLTDTTVIMPPDAPLDLVVTADSMSLTVLQAAGQQLEHVTGYLDGRLAITNTINAPIFEGRMAMRNAAFTIPRFGIDYQDVTLSISFDSTDIRLDTLRARRGEGLVTGSGVLTVKDDVMSGVVKSSDFRFDARNFYVVRHNDYEVQISGNAGLGGTAEGATYNGTITVNRSSIYLPALMDVNGSSAAVDLKGLPMLVNALRDDELSVDSNGVIRGQFVDTVEQYTAIYENLRGALKLKFPRNSWIRSKEMRLEIGGQLDIVKEGRAPELFGTVRVIRGQYDLYGRRFNIKEGQLVFRGGTEFDPHVTLEAVHKFRTAEREKKTLTLYVSGRASAPEIRFELDNREIPEGDAVAYLLFGRSLDQLTSGQRTAIGGGGVETDVAKRIAANFVSNRISETIGQQLNLDVIEIKAQENLSAATLTVGKYLTSDLFVSYQRGIGSTEDDDIARELVTLEYELTRFLYLQLVEGDSRESGADVIFKFEF